VCVVQARMPDLNNACWLAFTSAHYLSLLAIPLLVLLPPARLGKVFWAALAIMTAAGLWLFLMGESFFLGPPLKEEYIFPYVGDLFTARGVYMMIESLEATFCWSFRLLPTTLGCIGTAVLIDRTAEQGWRLVTRPLVIFSLLHLAALAIAPKYYDRYLLPLVPGALALVAWEHRPPRWKTGLAALVLLGSLSVCLMHDWLSRNAACWDLGRRISAHGIDPSDIQGGFEWDHWHLEWRRWYPRFHQHALSMEMFQRAEEVFRRGHPGHFRLSLSRSRHDDVVYEVIDVEPFTQWFPPRKRAAYLVRRPRDETGPAAGPETDESREKEQPPGMD
jgi:hypothetical protein